VPIFENIRYLRSALRDKKFAAADHVAIVQVATTVVPIVMLWWLAAKAVHCSVWLLLALIPVIGLFTLRAFTLMHDCGHYSLFQNRSTNRIVGFFLGVLTGMPQYVWAKHHDYHHAHNGDWEVYRGPYATRSTAEYAAMTHGGKRFYRWKCSVYASPIAGFIYLVFNPRYTWLRGSIGLCWHMLRQKIACPRHSLRAYMATYQTRYWKTSAEFRYMSLHNIAFIGMWICVCRVFGSGLVVAVGLASIALAGAAGIVLFTVQHNFEKSYASTTMGWDVDDGAIYGTSFLLLPRWLNWFTLDIAFHHVHHLSTAIPNYRLAAFHQENAARFAEVVRIPLSRVLASLKCILWDVTAREIITVSEWQRRCAWNSPR